MPQSNSSALPVNTRWGNSPKPLLIRADAGDLLGTGHVMRMIALAQAWQDRGACVHMACVSCPDGIAKRVQAEGIHLHWIDAEFPGEPRDASETRSLAHHLAASVIVLDGYHFTEIYQKALAHPERKLVCIDDYGHCQNWQADLVINQNLHASGLQQTCVFGTNAPIFLLGPDYAMLRREFRNALIAAKPSHMRHLLVTFGGVDPHGATMHVLRALSTLPNRSLVIRVLVGAGNPLLDEIQMVADRLPHAMEIWVSVVDMPAMYQWADAVISAAGSSCYEWLYFGLPAWVVPIAANQDAIAAALAEMQLAKIEDSDILNDPERLRHSLHSWLLNPSRKPAMMVDGQGAARIVAALSTPSCWIRRVEFPEDADYLFDLANERDIRNAGFHTEAIQRDEHIAWLERHTSSSASALFAIIRGCHEACGLVRFHLKDKHQWEIGISLFPYARGSGIAVVALALAMREMRAHHKVASWLASVRPENSSSQKLFASLGFLRTVSTGIQESWILSEPAFDPCETPPP